jgi:hypothetical protein
MQAVFQQLPVSDEILPVPIQISSKQGVPLRESLLIARPKHVPELSVPRLGEVIFYPLLT